MGTPTLSFVLPVYNERESLPALHQKIVETMAARPETFEMVFVDDGSTDGSIEVLTALHRDDRRVKVVQFRRNFGKSAAYTAGFEHACGEFIITMDTDLQDDPAEIPLFLQKLADGYDVVSGWKHEGKGALEKSLPSRFFNSVVRRATGIKRYLRGMLDLMTVLFITRFANRPMHLLGLAGLVTSSLGSAVLLFFIAA